MLSPYVVQMKNGAEAFVSHSLWRMKKGAQDTRSDLLSHLHSHSQLLFVVGMIVSFAVSENVIQI